MARSAADIDRFLSIGPYQTETCSKGVHRTDLVKCLFILTQCSTSSSILWQVPLWQTIADHGRVCCAITNLQSRPLLRITHTLRRRCRTLFIRLQPAPTISASRFLRFFLRVRWFLGLVIRLHLSYPTIRVTRAGWRCRSPSLPCVRRRMGLFLWHLLLTQVLLASITITLHQHTPPIIIGVADVAFNSCLRPHMPRYELVYMHHIILLYSTIHLLARSHTTYYFPHFWTRSIHPRRMSFSLPQFQRSIKFFFFIWSRTCVSHPPPLALISVYNCARAI
jgi:hypothetical protein